MDEPYRNKLQPYYVFVKNVFEIIEWAIVAVALTVAGKRLSLAYIEYAGLGLTAILALYIGMKADDALNARRREAGREGSSIRFLLTVVVAGAFGFAFSLIVTSLTDVALMK